MVDYLELLRFLAAHWQGAAAASVAFLLGAVAARYVVRSDLRFFMAIPLWFLNRIATILKRNPPILYVAAFIFAFNGTAMFVYMLFGLIPYMPAVIAFMTGMNVAIAALKSGEFAREGLTVQAEKPSEPSQNADTGDEGAPSADQESEAPPSPEAAEPNPRAILCSVLVLALELPCFWFAIALGAGMFEEGYWLATVWQEEHLSDFGMRLLAYALVILPVLAVSALAEGYAVKRPTRPAQG